MRNDEIMAFPLGKTPKRTLKDIEEWLNPEEVYHLIISKTWPYKKKLAFYRKRDRALMALYFITGGRNNEVLKLKKSNFDLTSDPQFSIIKGMYISKRAKKTIARYGAKVTRRIPIRLPLFGDLLPFTLLVVDYLDELDDEDDLFDFGVRRSHQIIKYVTGKWVHWFRAMSENFYGQVFRDAVKLAKFIGITNVQSVMAYIPFDEKAYEKDLLEKTKTAKQP